MTHDQLEELIEARGRELKRQLLQDHLDLRALREEQALPAEGAARRVEGRGRVERGRERGWPRCSARRVCSSCQRKNCGRRKVSGPGCAGFVPRPCSLPEAGLARNRLAVAATATAAMVRDEAKSARRGRSGPIWDAIWQGVKTISRRLWSMIGHLVHVKEWSVQGQVCGSLLGLASASVTITFGKP